MKPITLLLLLVACAPPEQPPRDFKITLVSWAGDCPANVAPASTTFHLGGRWSCAAGGEPDTLTCFADPPGWEQLTIARGVLVLDSRTTCRETVWLIGDVNNTGATP